MAALGFAVGAALLAGPVYYLVVALVWGIPLTRRAFRPWGNWYVTTGQRRTLTARYARIAAGTAVIVVLVGWAVAAWGSDRFVLGFFWGAAVGAILTLARMGRARRAVEDHLSTYTGHGWTPDLIVRIPESH